MDSYAAKHIQEGMNTIAKALSTCKHEWNDPEKLEFTNISFANVIVIQKCKKCNEAKLITK